MVRFNRKYFGLTVLLFLVEVLIALYVKDRFIRPYFGDVLVVILLYCFVRSFVTMPVFTLAMLILFFAFLIEFLQYLNIVDKLGLQNSTIASTVLGTSFAWYDILAYIAGAIIVLVLEKIALPRRQLEKSK